MQKGRNRCIIFYKALKSSLVGLVASDVPTITTTWLFFVSTNCALSSSFQSIVTLFLLQPWMKNSVLSSHSLQSPINDILPPQNPFDLCFMCTSSLNMFDHAFQIWPSFPYHSFIVVNQVTSILGICTVFWHYIKTSHIAGPFNPYSPYVGDATLLSEELMGSETFCTCVAAYKHIVPIGKGNKDKKNSGCGTNIQWLSLIKMQCHHGGA